MGISWGSIPQGSPLTNHPRWRRRAQVEIEDYKKYVQVWKKFIKIDENINLLLPDELLILSKYDFKDPQDIPHPPYKHPRINFLVFDDLVGDPHAFKKGSSAINNLTIREPKRLQWMVAEAWSLEELVKLVRWAS